MFFPPFLFFQDKGLIVDLDAQTRGEDNLISEDTASSAGKDGVSEDEAHSISTPTPRCSHPKILAKIAKLSDLLKSSRPSDLVVYNLTNVLYPFWNELTIGL